MGVRVGKISAVRKTLNSTIKQALEINYEIGFISLQQANLNGILKDI